MIQPNELKIERPMHLHDGVISTTTKVWEILFASKNGDIATVKNLVNNCPNLIYAQYNYTPPIHFAVREGHINLVKYLLENGAHDPEYKIYPFLDSLQTLANDRGYVEIVDLLDDYASNETRHKFKGDNGKIDFGRSDLQQEFEDAVHTNNFEKTAKMLENNPEFALDETYFWGEGVLMKPIQHQEFELAKLLIDHGATFPKILKWIQAYYFKFLDSAEFSLKNGMNPNSKSWQEVTILHDMAQKGFIEKAELLIKFGAEINPIDDEYCSTPLGMAARWGRVEMVKFLLKNGANANLSDADWATPLAWARKKEHHQIAEILQKAGAKR